LSHWQVEVLKDLLSTDGNWTLSPNTVQQAVSISRADQGEGSNDMLLAWRRLEELAAKSGVSGVCLKEVLKVLIHDIHTKPFPLSEFLLL
jgi:hypothetical protein